jgi:hypothetical protein
MLESLLVANALASPVKDIEDVEAWGHESKASSSYVLTL